MGGGDHGHHDLGPRMKVPHHSIYKVENHKELIQLQEVLASKGLKDPWIRNEAWRFDTAQWGTRRNRTVNFFTRGWKYGVAAFVATVALETAYSYVNPSSHGHH